MDIKLLGAENSIVQAEHSMASIQKSKNGPNLFFLITRTDFKMILLKNECSDFQSACYSASVKNAPKMFFPGFSPQLWQPQGYDTAEAKLQSFRDEAFRKTAIITKPLKMTIANSKNIHTNMEDEFDTVLFKT